MSHPEEELLGILKANGTDFTASLPCEKIKVLLEMLDRSFTHLPLTREEEGVGICAGAALAGRRPAMFVQSSGIGNMINALLSLTAFYELPLALFVSRRGVYQERIAAQLPMGLRLPGLLDGAGIPWTEVNVRADLEAVARLLPQVYEHGGIRAFLMSPAVWADSECRGDGVTAIGAQQSCRPDPPEPAGGGRRPTPVHTRFEILRLVAPQLAGKVVVCNLGVPSKELYSLRHQPSNFYMLGSMGMVTPIGLGVALSTRREVVVIDGDGSLLMNPGTLAVCAAAAPKNLTILAIDNGAYGSTGSQPTHAATCVDLEQVARGFGIANTLKTAGGADLIAAMGAGGEGPLFVHALAVPGNAPVPNIPLDHRENKREVMAFLRAGLERRPVSRAGFSLVDKAHAEDDSHRQMAERHDHPGGEPRSAAETLKADRTLDIRGQVCPLTFVRSKLAIEKMALGEVLEILVDHEPASVNVPRSMEHEGQTVLAVERTSAAEWHLFIRKDREKSRA